MFGPSYFMDEQVILVTLNYRLAGLGKYLINEKTKLKKPYSLILHFASQLFNTVSLL